MNNAKTTKYFDLHLKGIGYVNRIREVTPKKGNPFWSCSISALRGTTDSVEYTNLDCRISGNDAQKLIRRCEKAVSADKKVLIGFTVGDIYPEIFEYKQGKRKGETGLSIKGRLLFVSFIKVDGDEVYRAEKQQADDTEAQDDDVQETPVKPEASKSPRQEKDDGGFEDVDEFSDDIPF